MKHASTSLGICGLSIQVPLQIQTSPWKHQPSALAPKAGPSLPCVSQGVGAAGQCQVLEGEKNMQPHAPLG